MTAHRYLGSRRSRSTATAIDGSMHRVRRRIYTAIVGAFSLLCFVTLGAACQTQKATTQEVNEKAVTPSPTRTKLRVRDDSKRLINVAGWELPDLSLFKEVSREVYKTKNSIAKIEQRDYIPLADVIQYADGNTFFDVDRDPSLENKAWLIRRMKVFSAQGQPFCYVIRGDWVAADENGAIQAHAAMRIVLVYTDQDGDGIYEAFSIFRRRDPNNSGASNETLTSMRADKSFFLGFDN